MPAPAPSFVKKTYNRAAAAQTATAETIIIRFFIAKLNNLQITVSIDKNEKLSIGTENIKNFGYSAFSKIYHELELDKF